MNDFFKYWSDLKSTIRAIDEQSLEHKQIERIITDVFTAEKFLSNMQWIVFSHKQPAKEKPDWVFWRKQKKHELLADFFMSHNIKNNFTDFYEKNENQIDRKIAKVSISCQKISLAKNADANMVEFTIPEIDMSSLSTELEKSLQNYGNNTNEGFYYYSNSFDNSALISEYSKKIIHNSFEINEGNFINIETSFLEYLYISFLFGNSGYLYFVPPFDVSHKNYLNIAFFSSTNLSSAVLNKIQLLISLVSSLYKGAEFQKLFKEHSLKSAIAAIMARNGSHNIGSHILSNISHKILNPLDVLFLIKYIQQRWDFLAQVASPDWPNWTLPMRFKGQIMRGFYEQRLLLNNIAESEGLAAREDFGTHADLRNKISFEIKIFDGDGNPKEGDITLAIPGGITGVHAFYSILENIIRNTAKHAYKKKEDDGRGLKITIDVTDDTNKDYVEFFVTDNWTENSSLVNDDEDSGKNKSSAATTSINCPDPVEKKNDTPKDIKGLIENAIKERLIKDDGSLNYENWGIAEMKISAVYLRKEGIEKLNPPKEKDFLYNSDSATQSSDLKGTIAIESKQVNEAEFLGYRFAIPKPKEVGIIFPVEKNGVVGEDNKQPDSKYNQYGVWKAKKDQGDFDFIIEGEVVFRKKVSDEQNVQQENPGSDTSPVNSNTTTNVATTEVREADSPVEKEQWTARRGGLKINREEEINPFTFELTDKEEEKDKEKQKVELAKLKLFDERIKTLIGAKEQKGKDAEKGKITLVINPFEETKSKSFLNEKEIWKYYAHNIGSHFGPIAGIETDEWDKQKIKEFFDKNAEELSKDPWVTFSGSFNKKYEDLFNKLLISKKTIGQNYAKYEEDIETLPNEYLKKKTKNSDDWIKAVKKEIAKSSLETLESRVEIVKDIPDNDKDHTVVYKRHFKPTGNYMYAEALSGSQSYFNLILSPPVDDYSKILLVYELLETALIPIEIVDERMEQYVSSSPQIETRLNSLGAVVRQQWAKEEDKAPKYYKKLIDLKPLPEHRNALLIIHHGMLQKHSNDSLKTIDEILIGLTESYDKQNIFITTGKGQADITTGYKYLPFADVRSALMKPFPEKFILMKTLMKITPKPEKDGTS